MNRLSGFVSLHPYFKVPPEKLELLKGILPEFIAKTRDETGNLFYEFSVNGDEVFCREGYENAEALLAHLENVGAMLAVAMKMAAARFNTSEHRIFDQHCVCLAGDGCLQEGVSAEGSAFAAHFARTSGCGSPAFVGRSRYNGGFFGLGDQAAALAS